ncbi:hypothetical protein V6N13_019644 [Hibiscus sabdariffa]|uniref:Uncharacterized protein n=1 Tax=Hibiscus sabdariffa TaxID=183260 RepID=A0ABR2EKF6_9ROSI
MVARAKHSSSVAKRIEVALLCTANQVSVRTIYVSNKGVDNNEVLGGYVGVGYNADDNVDGMGVGSLCEHWIVRVYANIGVGIVDADDIADGSEM